MKVFTIRLQCTGCLEATEVELSGITREMAEDFCGMADGRSPFFVVPREKMPEEQHRPGAFGVCAICAAWFNAEVISEVDSD